MDTYKGFYWAALTSACLGLAAVLISDIELKLSLFAVGAMGLVVATCFSFLFVVRGNAPRRLWLLTFGLLLVCGGAGFDIYATLVHSSDLSREANPVARALLASGLDADLVVKIGFIAQALLVLNCSFVWINFVSRLEWYKQKIAKQDGAPVITRMLGVSGHGWWVVLTGRVDQPLFVSGIAPALLAVFAYRIYLGLEWFGSVPVSRLLVPAILFSLAFFIQWLWCIHWVRESRSLNVV